MIDEEKQLEEIRNEIKKYAEGGNQVSFQDVVIETRQIVKMAVFDAFGINYFADRAGGNVTTLHNFKQGITAARDEKAYKEYNEKKIHYDRKPFDKVQEKYRERTIGGKKEFYSGYTGKQITPDESQLEHVVSVAEVEKSPECNLYMTLEDRVDLVFDKDNLTMLESNINDSKDKMPLLEWLDKIRPQGTGKGMTNAEFFGIDKEKAKALDNKARKMMKKKLLKARIKKQGKEVLETGIEVGLKLGKRELCGIIFAEFADASLRCVERIMIRYRKGIFKKKQLISEFKTALMETANNLLNKYKEIITKVLTSAGSGFLSNFLTFIINNFITTYKKAVSLLREGIYTLIHAVRIIQSDEYETKKDKIDAVTDLILNAVTIYISSLIALSIQNQLVGVPFGDSFSQAIAVIVVGLTATMIMYYYESVNNDMIATTASVANAAINTVDVIKQVKEYEHHSEERIKRINEDMKRTENIINSIS